MTAKQPIARRRRRRNPQTPDRRAKAQAMPDCRALLDDAVQGIIIHRNFKPLYVNKAFAALFSYKGPEEIMGLPLLRPLVPDDAWPRLESEYDDLMRGAKHHVIGRARGVRKDGNEIWLAVTARVIAWPESKNGEKGTSKALMLTAFDITKQVDVEHTLLKSEQRLRAVLEILPYPIFIARRLDGQVLFVNRKSCLLFQQSAGQLLRGRLFDWFVDDADRENFLKLLESVSDLRDIEMKMKTGQGRIFTAEIAAITVDYGGAPAVLVALNDISHRKEMEAELFRQASTDALTGVSNRRYFQNQAEQELRRARRFARDMSVMMIDIDHFKPINDTYGHAAGDAVIQGVVKRSLEALRQSDSLGRVGGEEFAVLLPETAASAAFDVAERLRKHIEGRPIIAENHAVPCTVSIGIAQLSAQDGSIEDLLHRSDIALYEAKNSGRNRVMMAPPLERKDVVVE
ncbi:MAG: diguanylate cyclase [Alphaproteobacteria bacterium]|nr:diguanylate cyclase [Alphaproteobacteria bacterium]